MHVNLLSDVGHAGAEEHITELVSAPGIRIERIVSTGQASQPAFWYDQPWAEWVALLQGEAELMIEGETAARSLRAGDHMLLPPGLRHRVERTSVSPPAIWLAVHFDAKPRHAG
jgi:cupin 2 domain-containing protein